jgi:hypothetical protein
VDHPLGDPGAQGQDHALRSRDAPRRHRQHLATTVLVGVHMDAAARKATPFDPPIHARAQALVVADPTPGNEWPPQAAYLE